MLPGPFISSADSGLDVRCRRACDLVCASEIRFAVLSRFCPCVSWLAEMEELVLLPSVSPSAARAC